MPPAPPRALRTPLLPLALALCLLHPHPLFAQTPTPSATATTAADPTTIARTRFTEALALARKNRWAEAYPLFLEAWQNKQHWQIALNLGQAEIKVEKLRDAVEHLTFAETAPDTPDADRRQAAELRRTAQARLGHLRIDASPHGARVLVNGTFVGKAPVTATIDVDPGLNTVEIRLGSAQAEESIVTKSGETATVVVALPLTDIDSPPPTSPKPAASALTTSTQPPASPSPPPLPGDQEAGLPGTASFGIFTLGGLAVAGAAVGAGLFAISTQRGAQADEFVAEVKDHPSFGARCQLPACTAADEHLGQQDAFENAAIGAWIGSGITGAAAVGLWLLTRRARATTSGARPPHPSVSRHASTPTLGITITGQGGGFVVQGRF